MTIKQIIQNYPQKLCKTSSSPQLDVEVLLSHILKRQKAYLYAHSEHKITKFQMSKFQKLFNQRLKGTPVAYLTNHKEFFGLDFYVNENVLIPCPETEILVERTLKQIKNLKGKITIADIGAGSGAVIISVAKTIGRDKSRLVPKFKYFAAEISDKALKIARKNARRHRVLNKIKFFKGNLLEPIADKKVGVLVANLPYLDKEEKNLLPSIDSLGLKYEPVIAIDGGADGFDLYRQFFKQIFLYELKPKAILIEIGHRQKRILEKTVQKYFNNYKLEVIKDLAGFDRVAIINLG